MLIAGIVLALLAGVLSLKKSPVASYLLLISSYIAVPRIELSPAHLELSDFVFIGIALSNLLLALVTGKIRRPRSDSLLLYLIVFEAFVSAVINGMDKYAIIKAFQIAEFAMIYLFIQNTRFKNGGSDIVALVLWMTIAEGTIGMVQFLTNESSVVMMGGMVRASGTAGNYLAEYLLIGFAVSWALVIAQRSAYRSRRLALIASTVGIAGILATQVRSAWLGLAAILLASAFFTGRAISLKALSRWILVGLLAVAIFIFSGRIPSFLKVLAMRGTATVGARFVLWLTAIRIWENNLLVGAGPGSFGGLFLRYLPGSINIPSFVATFALSTQIDAHSMFFTTLSELGIVGITLYGAFAIVVLVKRRADLLRSRSVEPMATFLVAFLGVLSLLPGTPFDIWSLKVFWILIALPVGRANQVRDMADTKDNAVSLRDEHVAPPSGIRIGEYEP